MCIFCQIANGEIPVEPIFEDEDIFVFLDNNPVNPGHCLIIPKKHYENIEETPMDILQKIVVVIKEIGGKIKTNLGYPAYNVIVNNGADAGQEVMHAHWHIIPRLKKGELGVSKNSVYQEGEKEEILKKLKS